MLTILYLLVNTKNLILVVYRTYKFISGTAIPYLTYWDYDKNDDCFS